MFFDSILLAAASESVAKVLVDLSEIHGIQRPATIVGYRTKKMYGRSNLMAWFYIYIRIGRLFMQ